MMRANLIVLSQQPTMEPLILHVDEIRNVERQPKRGSRIITQTGTLLVDEDISEIWDQHVGRLCAVFSVPQVLCDDCQARGVTLESIAEKKPEPIEGPTMQDLQNKNLSVRAMCIARAAYPVPEDADLSKYPLRGLSTITPASWAALPHSSPEIAAQIIAAIRSLMPVVPLSADDDAA